MKSSRYSLNNNLTYKCGKATYSCLIPTAVIILILSFSLKTAGSSFLIVAAVLFTITAAVTATVCKNKSAVLMFVTVILFCLRSISIINSDISYAAKIGDANDSITATVISSPNVSSKSCIVTLDKSQFDATISGNRFMLYSKEVDKLNIGDVITAQVEYTADFENKESFYSDGIYFAASADNIKIVGRTGGIYGFAGSIREYAERKLISNTDNYHVLLAVSTGERGYVSDTLYDMFKDAGVSHILVVSGMHLALICGVLDRILTLLCRKSIVRDIILLSFIFIMCAVCGFGISMVRAGLVYLIRVIMRRLGRMENGMSSLALSTVIVAFVHPFVFYSISFQLSYGAVLGIYIFPPLMDKYIIKRGYESKLMIGLLKSIALPLGAMLATLPTMVSTFGRISLVSVPVNILVGLPTSIMLSLCVVGLLLGFVPFVCDALLCVSDILADYFVKIVEFFSSLSFAVIKLKNTEILTILILLIYLALYMLKTKPIGKLKKR